MPRLSRLALAAALTVGLAPAARAAEPDRLLPPDADTVSYVNVKQVVDSDIVKKYALEQIKQALAGQEAKQILEEMGLNPLADIEKVWIGSSGKDHTDMQALVIVRGKFVPEKLVKAAEGAAKKDGGKFSVIKDGGATLLTYQPKKGDPVYGTVVDESTVVLANDKKLVTAAVKQAGENRKAPIAAELADLVKAMDEKASAFAVSIIKGKLDNVKVPPQVTETLKLEGFEKALPKAETLTVVARVADGIALEVVFGMRDADAAADMAAGLVKVIESVKALAPLLAATDPKAKPLTDVVKTLKSGAAKKNVTVSAKLTGDNLGKMIGPGDDE
jgi:hypothetical protein